MQCEELSGMLHLEPHRSHRSWKAEASCTDVGARHEELVSVN